MQSAEQRHFIVSCKLCFDREKTTLPAGLIVTKWWFQIIYIYTYVYVHIYIFTCIFILWIRIQHVQAAWSCMVAVYLQHWHSHLASLDLEDRNSVWFFVFFFLNVPDRILARIDRLSPSTPQSASVLYQRLLYWTHLAGLKPILWEVQSARKTRSCLPATYCQPPSFVPPLVSTCYCRLFLETLSPPLTLVTSVSLALPDGGN